MNVRLIAAARIEFDEAVTFYLGRSDRAATDFVDAFERTKSSLSRFPFSGSRIRPDCRRTLVHNFPYQLIYRIRDGEIVVYAVAHQKRRPGYWRKRLSQ